MAASQPHLQVSLPQAGAAIAALGATNTILLTGQPGVGKSSLLAQLVRQLPGHCPAYIDCACLDLGDLAMPMVDRETCTTSYAPSRRFQVHQTQPIVLMLDELGKAPRPVLNMLLPTLLERRLGDVTLPAGSLVFATTNLATDGVGDNIPAHAHNRMTVLDLRNPTFDEWYDWAAPAGIHSAILSFARFNPCFQRYDELAQGENNPFIFNPRTGAVRAFVSPRSLEKASNILHASQAVNDSLLPLLAGTVGAPAAHLIHAEHLIGATLPPPALIFADPSSAPLPTQPSGFWQSVFRLEQACREPAHIAATLSYAKRWTACEEARALLMHRLASNKNLVGLAVRVPGFAAECSAAAAYL